MLPTEAQTGQGTYFLNPDIWTLWSSHTCWWGGSHRVTLNAHTNAAIWQFGNLSTCQAATRQAAVCRWDMELMKKICDAIFELLFYHVNVWRELRVLFWPSRAGECWMTGETNEDDSGEFYIVLHCWNDKKVSHSSTGGSVSAGNYVRHCKKLL